MLMMCWFYCIPFAKGMFFGSSGLMILFSLFMLKRGIRQSRLPLRQGAFLLMFIALLKFFIADVYLLKDYILCGSLFRSACTTAGFNTLMISSVIGLLLSSLILFNFYRGFILEKKQPHITPAQVRLELWSNLSLTLVVSLIVWLAAPWVGYLTVGHVPALFMQVPWQHLAVLNLIVLLIGFWKLEDCSWIFRPAEKLQKEHITRVWTPRDTLWLSVILFLIAAAFSYISSDVLSMSLGNEKDQIHIDVEDIIDRAPKF